MSHFRVDSCHALSASGTSVIPLCFCDEECRPKYTASPPATYAVPRFPVRHARADSGWGGRVGQSTHAPLCVPYAAERPSARTLGDRASGGAQCPHRSSHTVGLDFRMRTVACAVLNGDVTVVAGPLPSVLSQNTTHYFKPGTSVTDRFGVVVHFGFQPGRLTR